jgi:hypothetical protein
LADDVEAARRPSALTAEEKLAEFTDLLNRHGADGAQVTAYRDANAGDPEFTAAAKRALVMRRLFDEAPKRPPFPWCAVILITPVLLVGLAVLAFLAITYYALW